MVLSGYICAPHTNEGMADQPVKKKLRIDAPDIDDGSDKSTEDVLTDIFDSESTAETSEEFPSRNGESPDSGTVSEDAVDCSAILRLPSDSAVEIIPSCSYATPHCNTEDDKLLAELRIIQHTLVGQCLCTLNENVISQLFDRRLKIVNWSVTCSLTYLSTMQLMFDIYLKQNNIGTICSRLMHTCDIFVRNQHDWITDVIELADHKSKYITFVASRVLASFLIVAKDTINENWLKQIAENIYMFERINRITIQKINFSLDVIKRIVEWKDVEQHPLEDSNSMKTSVNMHAQVDNPFRSNASYGASSSSCQPLSSHSDNLHNAFSNLQTHSVASTSSGEKATETRPVMFRLQEPVLKFPNLNQPISEGEQSNSVSPEPPPSRIERLNENGCVTVILTDSESFDTSHIKCLTIKTLERHWPILVNNMKLLLLRYLNLANAENCILTFFSLWENIISVKANLSVIDTKRFYADLQSFVDLLRDTNIPSLIYTHMLSLFNEVLCYGSTLALQDILPEEICNLAHSIVRFVKDFRLLNDVRIQNSRNGFGFLGHECVIVRNYSLGPEVVPLSSSIQLVDQSYGEDDNEDDPSHARGEVDKTMLQRMSLLVLKSVAVTVKEMRCDSSDSSIDSSDYNAIQDMQIVERSIRDVLKKLDLFIRNTLEFHPETPFTKMLVHLFSEQDDYLIESMVCTLDITVGIVYRNSMYPDLITMLNPIASFIEFLIIVSNDSDVLLDYLVSNETCFLLYLLRFLKYVRRNWPKFIETCQQSNSGSRGLDNTMRVLIRLRLQISRLVSKSLFPYNIGPVLRLLELCESLYEGNELS